MKSFEELSPEFQEKAKACKSMGELMELAESLGVHLSDEQLESVAGGTCRSDCPWHRSACRVDSQCMAKNLCPVKDSCPDFFSCVPKHCSDFTMPPIEPIEECKEFDFGEE